MNHVSDTRQAPARAGAGTGGDKHGDGRAGGLQAGTAAARDDKGKLCVPSSDRLQTNSPL